MQLRKAKKRDLSAIVRIYNASIPDGMATADTEPVTMEERQGWFASHQQPAYPLLVATAPNERHTLWGWGSLSAFYGRPAYAGTREVAIYIAPEARRRGVGTTLLTALIDEARQAELHTLLAYIFSHNEPSLNLFRQAGFAVWGHCPGVARNQGQAIDLTILGLTLSSAP
ncbi:MAG: N-acetyltransferase family protein [Natronospirillum sp.]|uniref:GNAT family N-acetyltransferase n=1 Tax=Natronospirillum sp. TaxID=2812955 RepID=UPI0025E5BB28|nr:GNAT family N-acetyltransferase [Natronospirillum sp.]MCH8552263.1 N-acetyltransferase family protein [Natronospirillum sp.]